MSNLRYKDINYQDIGRRVRVARKKKNLTQQTLAEIVNLAPSNISHIERGTTKLSVQSLIRIANALDISIDYLLCDNLDNQTGPFQNELSDLLQDCSPLEIRILSDIVRNSKKIIRKYS